MAREVGRSGMYRNSSFPCFHRYDFALGRNRHSWYYEVRYYCNLLFVLYRRYGKRYGVSVIGVADVLRRPIGREGIIFMAREVSRSGMYRNSSFSCFYRNDFALGQSRHSRYYEVCYDRNLPFVLYRRYGKRYGVSVIRIADVLRRLVGRKGVISMARKISRSGIYLDCGFSCFYRYAFTLGRNRHARHYVVRYYSNVPGKLHARDCKYNICASIIDAGRTRSGAKRIVLAPCKHRHYRHYRLRWIVLVYGKCLLIGGKRYIRNVVDRRCFDRLIWDGINFFCYCTVSTLPTFWRLI